MKKKELVKKTRQDQTLKKRVQRKKNIGICPTLGIGALYETSKRYGCLLKIAERQVHLHTLSCSNVIQRTKLTAIHFAIPSHFLVRRGGDL